MTWWFIWLLPYGDDIVDVKHMGCELMTWTHILRSKSFKTNQKQHLKRTKNRSEKYKKKKTSKKQLIKTNIPTKKREKKTPPVQHGEAIQRKPKDPTRRWKPQRRRWRHNDWLRREKCGDLGFVLGVLNVFFGRFFCFLQRSFQVFVLFRFNGWLSVFGEFFWVFAVVFEWFQRSLVWVWLGVV